MSAPPDFARSLEEARRLLAADSAGEAANLLRALAARRPEDDEIWQVLADCHKVLGDQAAELDACERALAIEPVLWWLRMRAAEIHAGRGELAEAAAHYEIVSNDRPQYVKPALRLARVCGRLGDARREAAAWTRVAALEPDNAEARKRLAALRSRVRQDPSVAPPPSPTPMSSWGLLKDWKRSAQAHEEAGDFEAAKPYWRRVLELDPDDIDAPERLALAEIIAGEDAGATGKTQRVIVLGNCQSYPMAACLRALNPEIKVAAISWAEVRSTAQIERLLTIVQEVGTVLVQPVDQPRVQRLTADALAGRVARCVQFPRIQFTGFHPDAMRMLGPGLTGLIGEWHSALIMAGYRMGLPEARTQDLFNAYIYGALGYFDESGKSANFLEARSRALGWSLRLETWPRPFVHLPNHPRVEAMMEVARKAGALLGIEIDPQAATPADPFLRAGEWPVYPEIGKRLGLPGRMQFARPGRPDQVFGLEEAIAWCYARYARSSGDPLRRVDPIIEILKAEGV